MYKKLIIIFLSVYISAGLFAGFFTPRSHIKDNSPIAIYRLKSNCIDMFEKVSGIESKCEVKEFKFLTSLDGEDIYFALYDSWSIIDPSLAPPLPNGKEPHSKVVVIFQGKPRSKKVLPLWSIDDEWVAVPEVHKGKGKVHIYISYGSGMKVAEGTSLFRDQKEWKEVNGDLCEPTNR